MSAPLLYRIAAVLLLLYAIGHTLGFMRFTPKEAEGLAVWKAMGDVRIALGNSSFTYRGWYVGFGLFGSTFLVFSSYLATYLAVLVTSSPHALLALPWVFFALQLAGLVLCLRYFMGPPIVLSLLISICTGWAAWLVR